MSIQTIAGHIEVTPDIAGGKPHISGRRITVKNIAIWHERMGKTADEISAEYDLSLSEIFAALAYYFDHRAEIDQAISSSEEFTEALRQTIPSKLGRKIDSDAQHEPDN